MTTPYRDHHEALREKLASLEGELARVRDRLGALGHRQRAAAALEEEIAAVRAELEDGVKLENLRIAAPCGVDWNAMLGDDRVRFCDTCEKHVYDLSKLSRVEAERLVAAHDGPPPCVRLYKRRDGTVITNDCPVGRKRRRLRRAVAAGVGGAVLAAGAMMLRWRMGCSRSFQGSVGRAEPEGITPIVAIAMDAPPQEIDLADRIRAAFDRERASVAQGVVWPLPRRAEPPGLPCPVSPGTASGGGSSSSQVQPRAPSVVIRGAAFAGVDDVANARAVLEGMSAGFRRCVAREDGQAAARDGSAATTRDDATARMRIELASDGDVTGVTTGLTTMPPPTVACIKARVGAAHFAATRRDQATIDVEIEVRRDGGGHVRKQAP